LAAVVLDAAANAARFGKLANLLNVVFLGLVASAAGFVLWSAACRDLGVVRVTAALYLTPIVGVVFAAVFLGEKVTGLEILGGAAILVGVAIATLAPGGVCNKTNGVRSEI
jgi:drug/metabolite transporter (DMT)-like permease